MNDAENYEYAGFWIRTIAFIIDHVLISIITLPILFSIYGSDYFKYGNGDFKGVADVFLSVIFPSVAILGFWLYRSATPGKIVFSMLIVDVETGEKPSIGQFIGRYFAYILSVLPFFFGFFWIGIDKKKQGWHDKLAGTVVIRNKSQSVKFKKHIQLDE